MLTNAETTLTQSADFKAGDISEASALGRLPGQPAMWFFVIGDLWIFTCYFACYAFDYGQDSAMFRLGQQSLNQGIGAFNTMLLLTSSLLVAFSVEAARVGALMRARQLILCGGVLGVLFLVIKAFEWHLKIGAGLPAGTDDFFLYYFMFTGLHFFHVCLGLGLLFLVWNSLSKPNPNVAFVESGAIYWHMVDLLWIVIFALLYLLR